MWEPSEEDEPMPRILQGRGSAGLPRGETKCVRAEAAFNGSWRPQRAWPHLGRPYRKGCVYGMVMKTREEPRPAP